jgi:ATPase subunit of ABC transporter with duplicated ATPase domains
MKNTTKLNTEAVIAEMNDFLATIDSNVTTNLIKGGATYAQLFGDTVATRTQVFFMSTTLDVYCGNMTRTYELMNENDMYRRDTKQRLRKFKSVEEFKEFMQQLKTENSEKKTQTAKKTATKKVTASKTKKVSKKASVSA